MIVSFVHDCGCEFTRRADVFVQSHSCVKHAVKEASRAAQEPYIHQVVTPTPEDLRELFGAAQGALRQTPFGELLCADEFSTHEGHDDARKQ